MNRLFKINRTLLEKLEDTEYIIPALEKVAVSSVEAFERFFKSRDAMERVFYPRPGTIVASRTPGGVLIFFAEVEEGKKFIAVTEIRRLISKMEATGVTASFCIINAQLSPKANDALKSAQSPGKCRITTFSDNETLFNVTRHSRVPRHVLLSPAEANKWLLSTKLTRSQLPRIFEDDPQTKYIGAMSGDVVKIIRASPTTGTSLNYVTVVKPIAL